MNALLLMSAAVAFPAKPAPALDLQKVVASVTAENLSYSDGFGKRRVVSARSRFDMSRTKVQLGLAQGRRSGGDGHSNATQGSAVLVHDWGPVTTKTSASIASNSPVFANRDFSQEVSLNVLPTTVVTAGVRYARYFTGIDSWSLSLGATHYFRGGLIGYRFSAFETEHRGHSVGHLVSGKLDDPYGSTQAWVGHGTAIHDAEWLPTPEKGKYTNVEVARSLKLGSGLNLELGVKRGWYRVPSTHFNANGIRLGLTYSN
jgi:YaiO family outer membrane protein